MLNFNPRRDSIDFMSFMGSMIGCQQTNGNSSHSFLLLPPLNIIDVIMEVRVLGTVNLIEKLMFSLAGKMSLITWSMCMHFAKDCPLSVSYRYIFYLKQNLL